MASSLERAKICRCRTAASTSVSPTDNTGSIPVTDTHDSSQSVLVSTVAAHIRGRDGSIPSTATTRSLLVRNASGKQFVWRKRSRSNRGRCGHLALTRRNPTRKATGSRSRGSVLETSRFLHSSVENFSRVLSSKPYTQRQLVRLQPDASQPPSVRHFPSKEIENHRGFATRTRDFVGVV